MTGRCVQVITWWHLVQSVQCVHAAERFAVQLQQAASTFPAQHINTDLNSLQQSIMHLLIKCYSKSKQHGLSNSMDELHTHTPQGRN